jgi:hypothetical protein
MLVAVVQARALGSRVATTQSTASGSCTPQGTGLRLVGSFASLPTQSALGYVSRRVEGSHPGAPASVCGALEDAMCLSPTCGAAHPQAAELWGRATPVASEVIKEAALGGAKLWLGVRGELAAEEGGEG